MISIFAGLDRSKRSMRVKALSKNHERVDVSGSVGTREYFLEQAQSISLFGDSPVIVADGVLGNLEFSEDDFACLRDSAVHFIFLADKLLKPDEKKYVKFAAIERFDEAKKASFEKNDAFAIADAFGRRDKISAWTLYRMACEEGTQPEALAGMLFWKIKQLALSPSRVWKPEEITTASSSLVTLYHKAHRGEIDFIIGLESFLLSSLS